SRSHQHAFLGTVEDWLYQRVVGIEPAAPGYTRIRVKPHPVGDLDDAAAHVDSPLGRVGASWRRTSGAFHLQVEVPVGATAEVFVPTQDHKKVVAPKEARYVGTEDGYAQYEIGSGDHAFRAVGNAGGGGGRQG